MIPRSEVGGSFRPQIKRRCVYAEVLSQTSTNDQRVVAITTVHQV